MEGQGRCKRPLEVIALWGREREGQAGGEQVLTLPGSVRPRACTGAGSGCCQDALPRLRLGVGAGSAPGKAERRCRLHRKGSLGL